MSDFVDRFECLRLISDSVKVNGKEKAILLFIFRYSDSKTGYKWSYPSRERLKELYGTKRDETLDNILNTLYEKGVLVKRTGKRNRNEYSIIYDNLKNIDTPKNVDTKNVDTPENVGIVPPENVGIVPPENGAQKENKKKIKENIYSDLIKKYPGRKVKSVRDSKLPKILKEYSIEEIERCINRYAEECKGKEKRFILNESTFWNGRYVDYLDENFEGVIESKEEKAIDIDFDDEKYII